MSYFSLLTGSTGLNLAFYHTGGQTQADGGIFRGGYQLQTVLVGSFGAEIAEGPEIQLAQCEQNFPCLLTDIPDVDGSGVGPEQCMKVADALYAGGIELWGKTLGVIGFGRIGRAVGKIANAFGMNVIAYNRSQCEEGKAIGRYVSLDELLSTADVVSLHCPLFPNTKGIICKENIEKMKDGVIIINSSRGPLIVEEDLAAALHSGKVFAAAMDVVAVEPMRDDNPLLGAPNCIITPHIAWAPKEARQRIMNTTAENIAAFIAGNPINVVNK